MFDRYYKRKVRSTRKNWTFFWSTRWRPSRLPTHGSQTTRLAASSPYPKWTPSTAWIKISKVPVKGTTDSPIHDILRICQASINSIDYNSAYQSSWCYRTLANTVSTLVENRGDIQTNSIFITIQLSSNLVLCRVRYVYALCKQWNRIVKTGLALKPITWLKVWKFHVFYIGIIKFDDFIKQNFLARVYLCWNLNDNCRY